MVATTMYGIPNCDTVKKARAFLAARGVALQFHDYKKLGVPADRLDTWVRAFGWERVLNRKGTAWRQLDPAVQAGVIDAASAMALMCAVPSLIKRPVIERDGELRIGFDADDWARLFA